VPGAPAGAAFSVKSKEKVFGAGPVDDWEPRPAASQIPIPSRSVDRRCAVSGLPTFGAGRHFVEKDSISRRFAAIKKTHS